VDKASKYEWSMFLTQKSQIGQKVKPILQWLHLLKFTNKFIQSNNAGKNKNEKQAEEFLFSLELTAPYTPQNNGVVEHGFVTI
jgi:hypothetical protein